MADIYTALELAHHLAGLVLLSAAQRRRLEWGLLEPSIGAKAVKNSIQKQRLQSLDQAFML